MLPAMDPRYDEERRARILRAAGDLFTARGYAGVSMDDVLSVVGGSKSTLYRYFSDKVDLFRSAVGMILDEKAAPLRAFTWGERGADETLKALGHHFARVVLDPHSIAVHRLVTAEAERVEGLGDAFFQHGPAFGQSVIGGYLRDLLDAGVIDVPDPYLAGAQLYQAMLGDLQMRLLTKSGDPTEEEIGRSISVAVDTFLRGAATPAGIAAQRAGRRATEAIPAD
jgi:TetR/AcrR family transcriptional regulator, mexJK operon transcriptional repressor